MEKGGVWEGVAQERRGGQFAALHFLASMMSSLLSMSCCSLSYMASGYSHNIVVIVVVFEKIQTHNSWC